MTPSIVTSVPSGAARASAIGVAGGSAGVAVGIGVVIGVGSGVVDGSAEVSDGRGGGVAAAASGVGTEARFCGPGTRRSAKSAALSSVSVPEPSAPPGRRSMLALVAGAIAGAPSRQELVVAPQPTASTAVLAPRMRIATLPPVAANPDAYVASAIAA